MARDGLPPGLRFKGAWLAQLSPADSSTPQRILQAALNSDISDFAEPTDLGDHAHDKCYVIRNPLFLQIDEVVDISLPLEDRQQLRLAEAGTLKFLIADSRLQVIGISKKRMTLLSPTSIPGIKVTLLPPVEMRYGVLFLDDEKLRVEGGQSPPLVEHREFIFHSHAPAPPPPPPPPPPAPAPLSQPLGGFLSSDDDPDVPSDPLESEIESPIEAIDENFLRGSDHVIVIDSDDDFPPNVQSVAQVRSSHAIGEVLYVTGNVVECFDLRVLNKKGRNLFHLFCKIRDNTGEMVVRAVPALVLRITGVDPAGWTALSPGEKTEAFRQCKAFFAEMQPPLVLLEREGDADRDRFLLTTPELARETADASQ
jgi:hypothetical protein